VANIEGESRRRKISKSDVVRERLDRAPRYFRAHASSFAAIADLIGSIEGLPTDLATEKKQYLRISRYGHSRLHRR